MKMVNTQDFIKGFWEENEYTKIIEEKYSKEYDSLKELKELNINERTAVSILVVLFIDSDDYLMPNSISVLMKAKKQYPDADVIIGNVYEHRYKKNQYELKKQKLIAGGTEVRRWMLTNEFAISAWNKLFSRQFLHHNPELFR